MSTEQTSAVVEAVDATLSQAEGASPEVDAAAEAESLTTEFNDGLKTYGLDKRMPGGMKHHPKAPATEPAAPAAKRAEATPTPAEPTREEAAKPAEAERPETPQDQQRRLSSGFAKLERKSKSLTAREEAAKGAEARLVAERQAHESAAKALAEEREAYRAEQAEIAKLRGLVDSDELGLLDTIASKRGVSRQALFDRITRAMINGGKLDATDMAADLEKRLTQTKADAESAAQRRIDELRAVDEAKAKEHAERSSHAAQVAAEKTGFVSWVAGPAKTEYPLLAEEDPGQVAELAYQVGAQYARAHGGKAATFEQVARHLEQVCAFEKHKAESSMTAQQTPTGDSVRGPGAAQQAAKPEPTAAAHRPVSSPQTLTNQAARIRVSTTPARHRTDAQRLAESIENWK
jgi:hypothetical protein